MEVVTGEFVEIKDIDVKLESELSSVVVFDELHIKQEVKEEPLEDVEPGSPNYNRFHNYIKYEFAGSSQSVYCDTCWTYCKNAEELETHQETSPGCKQFKKSGLSIVEDLPGETCKIHALQTSGETADVKRYTDSTPGVSRSDTLSFVEPLQLDINSKSSTGKKDYISNESFCPQNSYIDTYKSYLTSEKQFVCDICNKTFIRQYELETHKLFHTGGPFHCEVCNKTFTAKNYLMTHMLLHTGVRPFHCEVCKKIFIHMRALNIHKQLHTGGRPFSCDVCNKTFNQNGNLRQHKLIHTGERPFSCDVCNKRFTRKGDLNKHKLTHTGERPFSCDVCNKTFNQNGSLKKHKLIHIGERPSL